MINTPAQAREIVAQALESGEYAQGYGCLEDTGKLTHCCLGVATREFMKCEQHSITPKPAFPNSGEVSFDGSVRCLHQEVQAWLGFATRFGGYKSDSPDDRISLAGANDNKVPFSEIAKLFRNPPEGLLAQ